MAGSPVKNLSRPCRRGAELVSTHCWNSILWSVSVTWKSEVASSYLESFPCWGSSPMRQCCVSRLCVVSFAQQNSETELTGDYHFEFRNTSSSETLCDTRFISVGSLFVDGFETRKLASSITYSTDRTVKIKIRGDWSICSEIKALEWTLLSTSRPKRRSLPFHSFSNISTTGWWFVFNPYKAIILNECLCWSLLTILPIWAPLS